jgi:two-component system CheB/CheR fusion protein
LHIKRFTPKATELTNLIQTDIGRPITDIVSKLKYDTLIEDAKKVLETLHSKSIEVQDKDGQWFQVRIIPYRTLTNMIDGLVITFLNINVQKQAEEKAKQLNTALQDMYNPITLLMDTIHEPLLILNENLCIVASNTIFCKTFQIEAGKILDRSIYQLWKQKVPENQLRDLFEKNLKKADHFFHFVVPYKEEKNKPQQIMINARRISNPKTGDQQILLAIIIEEP